MKRSAKSPDSLADVFSTTFSKGGGDELFQAIQDPVLVTTPKGIILEANQAALNAVGKTKEDVVGKGICKILHGGHWDNTTCALEEFLLTCKNKVLETRLPGLGGDYFLTISPVKEPDGQVHKTLLVARELTSDELRKVETLRTDRLASIGELAAGVAHEVNNPINGIINFAQLLLDDDDTTSLQRELLSKVVKEGERIASIITKLLSFARESESDTDFVDLKEVVDESVDLVQYQLAKESISITRKFCACRCIIVGNFSQLQQVILNIISNARYALNERYHDSLNEKEIYFECRKIERDDKNWIEMSVRDNGTGIPQGILDRLFDPFFTSKPADRGTGLGLSISYGIIKDHGGHIEVNSVLNKFSEIIIRIPSLEYEC